MDDLVQFLEDECIREPLINLMHCLLHADDTAIISTNRDLFIIKCNKMLIYFRENSLTLNLKKSSYMIINGKEEDVKCNIYLEEGEKDLEYKSSYVYLGVIITDNGNLRYDLETYIDNKRSNVTIKYNNLIRKHVNMPMKFKLQVLDSCVCSVLIYACETWGITNVQSLETSYRFGLKRALSVRDSTCNEIVYIETGRSSLCARISKQQLSFWKKLGAYIDENPNQPLKSLI